MSLRAQSTVPAPRRRRGAPEKAQQQQGVDLLRSLGAAVYVLGTRRPAGDYQGTRQTPGLPDVLAFISRRGAAGVSTQLWWEVKAPGGHLRPEQVAFQGQCFAAGVAHVAGDLTALLQWLVAAGYLKTEQLPAWRQP